MTIVEVRNLKTSAKVDKITDQEDSKLRIDDDDGGERSNYHSSLVATRASREKPFHDEANRPLQPKRLQEDYRTMARDQNNEDRTLPEEPIGVEAGKSLGLVEHTWLWSDDGKFVMLNAYVIRQNGRWHVLLLGDGLLPIHFETDHRFTHNLKCSWRAGGAGVSRTSVDAEVTLMEYPNRKRNYFKNYVVDLKEIPEKFRTISNKAYSLPKRVAAITCPLQKSIPYVQSLQGGLKVFDAKGTFSIRPQVHQMVKPPSKIPTAPGQRYTAVLCLPHLYGTGLSSFKQRDPRLLQEWLAWHRYLGFSHVHVYMTDYYDDFSQQVFNYYSALGFVTVHNWTDSASGGVVSTSWMQAQWLASNDCQLRARGVADFVAFADVDEFIIQPANEAFGDLLEWMDNEFIRHQESKVGFSLKSVNVIPVALPKWGLNDSGVTTSPANSSLPSTSLVSQFDMEEKACLPGFNCGVHDYGRQKFFLRVREMNLPIRVLCIHGITRILDDADKLHVQIPEKLAYLRHYRSPSLDVRAMQENFLRKPIGQKAIDRFEREIKLTGLLADPRHLPFNNSRIMY